MSDTTVYTRVNRRGYKDTYQEPSEGDLKFALNEIDYKYFGYYEFSPDQMKAFDILEAAAVVLLSIRGVTSLQPHNT